MKLNDNIECPFCNLNYKESLIYEGKYWRIILNDNQYYLGRAIIIIKRHIEDPMEISRGEIEELQILVRRYVKTLREIFSPDLFNYAILGNIVRHVHLHIIPRYKDERIFEDWKFKDENWNKHYYPYPNIKLPREIFEKLRDRIRLQWN